MTGHVPGQHLGWLAAAAVLAIVASTGAAAHAAPFASGDGRSGAAQAADVAPVLEGQVLGAEVNASSPRPASTPETVAAVAAVAALSNLPHTWPRIAMDEPLAATPPAPAPAPKAPAPAPKPAPVAPRPAGVWWSVYHGTNHVWMPTLGISKPVYVFACNRSTDPANDVYRWGCAGTNNVYLLGHAWGVFKALHDAYFNGKLKVGMPVVYADSHGHVHLYRVTKWMVTSPTNISWSGSLAVPSMTLQTCIGANSQYRLNVRLVQVSS